MMDVPSEGLGAEADPDPIWGHAFYAETVFCASAAAGNAGGCQSRRTGVPSEFLDHFVEMLSFSYQVRCGPVGLFVTRAPQPAT